MPYISSSLRHLTAPLQYYSPSAACPTLGIIPAVRPAPSYPFRLVGIFRRLDLSKLTGSWTRNLSPFARNQGSVSHFHGHCSPANTADTIHGIELTEPDVPRYILRGQTEYTMLSFIALSNIASKARRFYGRSNARSKMTRLHQDYVHHPHKSVQLQVG